MRWLREAVKWSFFKVLLPIAYFSGSFHPVRREALMIRQRKMGGPDNFAALEQELKNRGVPSREICLETDFRGYYTGCLKMARLAASFRWITVEDSVNAVLCLPLRKNQRLVQVWHACGAFKKWGYACAEGSFGEDEKTLRRYYHHEKYDLVTVSSRYVIPFYARAFGLKEADRKIRPLGTPRTDCYFDEQIKADARRLTDAEIDGAASKKLLLLAPTFRGELETASAPELPDLCRLSEALGPDWLILVKQHPAVKNRPDVSDCPAVREVSDLPMERLLMAADAAVTDYSSWIFEYALLNKPLFFYAADLADYMDERGFFIPYEEMIPGRFCRREEELISEIQRAEERFDDTALRRFRRLYMSSCDGHAARRVADDMLREGA